MQFWRSRFKFGTLSERVAKWQQIMFKCTVMLVRPVPFGALVAYIWYKFFFLKDIYLHERMEGITTAGWIMIIGVIYAMFIASVYSKVDGELNQMREAVKNVDFDTFINLRDEQVSPLTHVIGFALSMAVLSAFFSLKYPSAASGILVVGSVAYLFLLILLVIMEVDDPCSGLWFIKSIPTEWLKIDAKKYREFRNAERCKELKARFEEFAKSPKSTSSQPPH